jgi:hypothetical protein
MAANTSVAIPTDRATATAPVARFFVPQTSPAGRRRNADPRPSNTGVRIFPSPPCFPVLARNLSVFGHGGQNS